MDEQDNNIQVSEVQLNELMLRLGFSWDTDKNLWQPPEAPLSHLEALQALRLYEADK